MEWIELGDVRTGLVAPEFSLLSGAGQTITRSQHRQRCNVVLYFVPAASEDLAPLLDLLTTRRADFDEANACVYAISSGDAPASQSPLLLADPGGTVRAMYRNVFPKAQEPGESETFAVVLDRYSGPWYVGRGDPDEAAVDEALTKLWAIEYDCPE